LKGAEKMNNLLESAKSFFATASAWGANLPQYISVPLIIALSLVGTVIIVSLIMGLIRLVFGQKAIDFIKNIPQRLNNASNGVNDSQNRQ